MCSYMAATLASAVAAVLFSPAGRSVVVASFLAAASSVRHRFKLLMLVTLDNVLFVVIL